MQYLLITSIIWALSFPIIKGFLSDVQPITIMLFRFLIATLLFSPFVFKKINNKVKLFFIGCTQFGLMYFCYLASFKFLKAYEVAILTTTTPFYLILFNQILNKEKKFYLNAFLVILATVLFTFKQFPSSYIGILLMQLSNICFAIGQLLFKNLSVQKDEIKTATFYMYLGALVFTFLQHFSYDFNLPSFNNKNILALLYLSIIASGLGFYFWNKGVNKVNVKYLAIFNNLKIPLAVVFSIILLGEKVDILRIVIGSILFLLSFY